MQRRKTASERGRLSQRLVSISKKRRLDKPGLVVQDGLMVQDGSMVPDPWQSEDPWLPAEVEACGPDPWLSEHLVEAPMPDPWGPGPGCPAPGSQRPPAVVQLSAHLAAGAASCRAQGLVTQPTKAVNRALQAARIIKTSEGACTRQCQLPGCQPKGVPASQAMQFVKDFWDQAPEQRSHCIRTAYFSGDLAWAGPVVQWSQVHAIKRTWFVGDIQLCFARLSSLLGTGQRTLRKMIAGVADGRKTVPGVPAMAKQADQLMKCNTFFTELHQSAAVPDPDDTACATGRTTKAADLDVNPWESWDYDWGGLAPITVACQGRVLGLPRRYIGHCRLIDLYWQMAAEWGLLQELRPDVGGMPSFRTFTRCYKKHWEKMLVIRKESQHARCQLCSDLQRLMQRGNIAWADRSEAAKRLRQHLRDQYTDRMLHWSMRWSSRQVVPEVICIIIDSMGKWGSAWPKFHHDKTPHELEKISRPTMILTAALAHGWCTGLYLSLEPLGHGSVTQLQQ